MLERRVGFLKPMFLLLSALALANAQAPARRAPGARFGSIDGVAIPATVLNVPRETAVARFVARNSKQPTADEARAAQQQMVCERLRAAVQQAARSRAKTELGITASDAEVEARRKMLFANAANVAEQEKRYRARLQAAINDPNRSAADRQKAARDLAAATPAMFAKLQANYNARPAVEMEKTDAAVDAQLAARDPTFKTSLDDWNAHLKHPAQNQTSVGPIGADVKEYLDKQRAAWWQAETGKLQVTLSDPTLYTSCALRALGLTVPGH